MMQRENSLLAEELKNQEKKASLRFNNKKSEISKLQDKRLLLVQKIENEYDKQKQLEVVRLENEIKLDAQRKKLVAIDGSQYNSLAKQIKKAKIEIEKKNLRMNECIAESKIDRDRIGEMRKERTVQDKIYSKIEVQIKQKSFLLLEQIEEQERRTVKRNDLQNQMDIIKKKARKEIENTDKYYQEVLITEGNKEEIIEVKPDRNSQLNLDNSLRDVRNSIFMFANRSNNKIQQPDQVLENELLNYKDIISKLKQITQQDDLDIVIDYFYNGSEKIDCLYKELCQHQLSYEHLNKDFQKKHKHLKSLKEKRVDDFDKMMSNTETKDDKDKIKYANMLQERKQAQLQIEAKEQQIDDENIIYQNVAEQILAKQKIESDYNQNFQKKKKIAYDEYGMDKQSDTNQTNNLVEKNMKSEDLDRRDGESDVYATSNKANGYGKPGEQKNPLERSKSAATTKLVSNEIGFSNKILIKKVTIEEPEPKEKRVPRKLSFQESKEKNSKDSLTHDKLWVDQKSTNQKDAENFSYQDILCANVNLLTAHVDKLEENTLDVSVKASDAPDINIRKISNDNVHQDENNYEKGIDKPTNVLRSQVNTINEICLQSNLLSITTKSKKTKCMLTTITRKTEMN